MTVIDFKMKFTQGVQTKPGEPGWQTDVYFGKSAVGQ